MTSDHTMFKMFGLYVTMAIWLVNWVTDGPIVEMLIQLLVESSVLFSPIGQLFKTTTRQLGQFLHSLDQIRETFELHIWVRAGGEYKLIRNRLFMVRFEC